MICESWPWTVYIYLCSSEYPGIFGGKIYIHLALADLLYPIWYAPSVYQRWCICLRTCLESQYKRFILQAYLLWGNGEMKQTKPSQLVECPIKTKSTEWSIALFPNLSRADYLWLLPQSPWLDSRGGLDRGEGGGEWEWRDCRKNFHIPLKVHCSAFCLAERDL